jgi:predicted dehydrogenase
VSGVLRIGVLGAARIARSALIEPARLVPSVSVTAVATRDPGRAQTFALQHGIPSSYGSYEELLAAPDVDAVYIPLPNSLHAPWTLRAIDAGKHVLCEKPFASNAAEALTVAAAAERSGLAVMEAMHYRYHPLVRRMAALLADGAIGVPSHAQAWTRWPVKGSWRHPVRLRAGRRRADGRRLLRDRLPSAGRLGRRRGRPVGSRGGRRPDARSRDRPGDGGAGRVRLRPDGLVRVRVHQGRGVPRRPARHRV